MTNDKDSAVLAERVERVTKWLDGGCSTWGTPMQDIREILNALRQPSQSDAEIERLREALGYYAQELMTGPWGIDSLDFGDVARAALEQSK